MTREEARQIIATWLVSSKGAKGQRGYIEGWFDEEDAEAFSMAIEALSADAVSLTGTMKYLTKPHNYCEVVRCKKCKFEFICRQTVEQANADEVEHIPLEWCSYGERADKCE